MKKSYRTRKNSGGLHLFTILGIGCAFVFAVGAMKQAGIRLVHIQPNATPEESIASASLVLGITPAISSETADEIVVIAAPTAVEPPKTITPSPSAESSLSKLSTEAWINQFDEVATVQALDQGVPAGIALAYGLIQVKKGATITNWKEFTTKVIEPLAQLKTNASASDRSTYFKYSANSSLWAEGLDANGKGNAKALKALMEQHQLEHYDNEVKRRLKGKTSTNPDVEKKAEAVAKKVTATQTSKAAKAKSSNTGKIGQSKSDYDAAVGKTVAKEIARKKLSTGKYITEADMERLLKETNEETVAAMQNKTMFMGRKINQEHLEANGMMDKTNPKNAQARGEYHQERLQAKRTAGN
jgi:hypothetical protein